MTTAGALTLTRDVTNGLLAETQQENVTTRVTYDGFGEPTADSAWVGATLVYARTYERDALGRLTEVVDASDGTTTVWGYGYDAVGRLATVTRDSVAYASYGYDAVGRLATVTRDSVAYASYGYDANGNRLTRTTGSGTETGVYDAQDRLTSYGGATYTYTAAGELSERVEGADTTRYDYDALGNLIEVELPDGTVVAYTIDGRNRRVGRSVDGAAVQGLLYGDQLNPVAELDSAGAVVSRFVYGTKANVPDYIVRGADTYRVLSDHLGSVRLVVDATTGSVAQRLSYDAWGRVLEDTSPGFQPFGFAGGITDPLTGLVRFGARDYDPAAGRWTAKDPIGFRGGSNLYAYVLEDPANSRDPSGLQGPVGIVLGAAAGGVGGWISGGAAGFVAGAFAGAAIGAFAAPQSWQAGAAAGAAASLTGQFLGRFFTASCWGQVLDFRSYDWFAVVGAAIGGGAAIGPAQSAGRFATEAALQRVGSLRALDQAPAWGRLASALASGLYTGVGEWVGSWFGQGLPGGRPLDAR